MGLWIPAKAWLAQVLITRAWEQAMASGRPAPPWPWADTSPVARLLVPRLGIDQIVLAHAHRAQPRLRPRPSRRQPGCRAIPAWRSSAAIATPAFASCRELAVGDEIRIQRGDGSWIEFRMTAGAVLDERNARLPLLANGPARLALTTCYPFDAIRPGGPLRYVAWAEAR